MAQRDPARPMLGARKPSVTSAMEARKVKRHRMSIVRSASSNQWAWQHVSGVCPPPLARSPLPHVAPPPSGHVNWARHCSGRTCRSDQSMFASSCYISCWCVSPLVVLCQCITWHTPPASWYLVKTSASRTAVLPLLGTPQFRPSSAAILG